MEKKQPDSLLDVSRSVKYRTASELIEKSRPSEVYYMLLVLSAIIIAGGILTNSFPIIIGGMLVTPLLSPILVISLALATGQIKLLQKKIMLLLKSIMAIVLGSLILGFLFGGDVIFPEAIDTMSATFLYFIVALASGVAVTYAWIRREASEILPGIAIVVSLVPPISYIGVALSQGEFIIARTFFIIFTLNLIGIILGSLGVFLISRFSQVEKAIERKQATIEKEEEKQKEEKAKEKEEKKQEKNS